MRFYPYMQLPFSFMKLKPCDLKTLHPKQSFKQLLVSHCKPPPTCDYQRDTLADEAYDCNIYN